MTDFCGLGRCGQADEGVRCSEQEHLRDHESSDVNDRTEHEIYVHPFMRAVQAGVASVMCSYSKCPSRLVGFACDADLLCQTK